MKPTKKDVQPLEAINSLQEYLMKHGEQNTACLLMYEAMECMKAMVSAYGEIDRPKSADPVQVQRQNEQQNIHEIIHAHTCNHKWGLEFSTHNHEPARTVCVKCGYKPDTHALNTACEPVKVLSDEVIESLAFEYCDETGAGGDCPRFIGTQSLKAFACALLAKYSEVAAEEHQ